MRRYDDPVEVRRGWVEGPPHRGPVDRMEGPELFLWRGRLWKVRAVLAHWVETGPWWQAAGVRAVIGSDEPTGRPEPGQQQGPVGDLLVERELWRVEAGRGGAPDPGDGHGVFDLSFDWNAGSWQLVGCVD
ncbi:MAG: DUF6504 family protein [Nocardioides sp.]